MPISGYFPPSDRPIHAMIVVGARPNYPKIAPICHALDARVRRERIRYTLVDTGQHYDRQLAGIFQEEFGLRAPDISFGQSTGTHGEQTAAILVKFERVLIEHRPDVVVVVGDVNSTVACAMAAVKLHIPVAHVEAGLRSFDRAMPEEINRLLTDQIADLCFTTEAAAGEQLRGEGVAPWRIVFAGNVMIDTLCRNLDRAKAANTAAKLGLPEKGFALVTLHRPGTTDDPERLQRAIEILQTTAKTFPVAFPIHPRTKKALTAANRLDAVATTPGLHLLEPQGYLDFLNLQMHAAVILSDSGGIQEESTFLRVPCLTLRPSTERPITCAVGTNAIVDLDVEKIAEALARIAAGEWTRGEIPPMWDGHAAERIADALLDPPRPPAESA